jgi:hypothetical protein
MTATLPGALPQVYTPSNQTLLANNHDQRHADDRDDIRALGTKLGLGASAPTAGAGVLRATGAGTTAYQKVPAADVSAEAWTDWTPTLSQNGARTLTVQYARYIKLGRIAHVQIMVTCTNAGTAGNAIIIGALPGAISPLQTGSSRHCGSALTVIGGSHRNVAVVPVSSTTLQFMGYGVTNYLGIDPSVALANGDTIACTLMYETAS